jgi:biotin carboxyl carrier protein
MMNSFVVTINGKKIKISFNSEKEIIINDKVFGYNISHLNFNTHLFKIGNKIFISSVVKNGNDFYTVTYKGKVFESRVLTELQEKAADLIEAKAVKHSKTVIKAPMPGLILKVKKEAGDVLTQGDSILILEAMKMENDIRSPVSGIIKEIRIKEGEAVEKGAELLIIE